MEHASAEESMSEQHEGQSVPPAQQGIRERRVSAEALLSRFFRPSVRILFDWERCTREGWPVEIRIVEELAVVERWHLPWNATPAGAATDFLDPTGRPRRLDTIPGTLDQLLPDQRENLDTLVATYRAFARPSQPIQLVAVAYALPDGGALLLDSCHRLCALTLARVLFALLTTVIHGPIDNAVVPELRHWETEPLPRRDWSIPRV